MNNIKKFKDLIVDGLNYFGKQYIEIDKNNIRIYYQTRPGGKYGFDFVVLHYTSIVLDEYYDEKQDPFENDSSFKAEVLFHGNVLYDGLRHFFMGHGKTDNENYLFWPPVDKFPLVFTELNKLIEKHCQINNI